MDLIFLCIFAYHSYLTILVMKNIIKFFLRNIPRKYLQRVVYLATSCSKIFYLGNKVECPICGKHYRRFLPYGYVISRENALCPNCLSLERHRLLWLYLKEKTNLFKEDISFLHIAPELCFIPRFRKQDNIKYTTADLESPWADIHLNIENMPIEDNSYDALMANHILEHVDNLDKALSEIRRVLKPGGWAILISPINPKRETTYSDPSITNPIEREKHFGQKDHVREFGKDYAEVLRESGLEVIEDRFIESLDKEILKRYALADIENLNIENHVFICFKR
ncbi:MAG: methyltransferase protein [Bacteroidetes bacterium]|nr:methyltransferase protein [Bacteroidota bacterium]